MEKIIMYKAEDGKIFDSEQACLEHEGETIKYFEKIWAAMLTIKEICQGSFCSGCPFYNDTEEKETCCVLKQNNPCLWKKDMINKEKL